MAKNNKKLITSDDILGKEAVDPEGSILGTITKVHISPKDMAVVGITVDMGILRPDLFIGSKYIKQFGIDAVLLKKVPADKYKGLKVLTAGGELIGKVKNVVMDNKKVKEFVVASKKIMDGHYIAGYSDIKEIGDHIILKHEDHKKLKKK